jgi:hypothetical protein
VVACVLGVTLSGCFAEGNPSETKKSPSAPPAKLITKEEFNKASKYFDYEEDEFTQVVTIGPNKVSGMRVKVGSEMGTLVAGISSDKPGGPYLPYLIAEYVGSDWIFFDSVDIKSSKGTMTVLVEKSEKVQDVVGNGRVQEVALEYFDGNQLQKLRQLLKGTDFKFRLNGSGDKVGEDFTARFSNAMATLFNEFLVLHDGLEQGLNFPN